MELALASGYQNIVAGIETSYDTNKSDVTKWTAAAGLLMDDYQVCSSWLFSSTTALPCAVLHILPPLAAICLEGQAFSCHALYSSCLQVWQVCSRSVCQG